MPPPPTPAPPLTDLEAAQLALQESEIRFRQLAEAVKEGFFVYEIETSRYSYINSAYRQIRGIDPENGPDSEAQWLTGIHPDDRDPIVAALEQERQGENFDQEYRFRRPDGELRWLRSRAFPIRDAAGAIVRIVGTVEDISDRKYIEAEQKRTEAALRESEALFRSAFDDAPIGLTLVSSTGQFIMANAYFCTLVGYTEAELRHLTFQAITHPDDLSADLTCFAKIVAGQVHSSQMEKRYIDKQGKIVSVLIDVAPVCDAQGQFLYCVGQIQDIRDRLAIDRMKDEFISVISHELRTPITSIQGALVLLGAGVYADRPEKARHMLDIAITNSDRLVRLVDNILSFERLESGRVQLEPEPCQVAYLLYQAIDSVQPLADQAGITLALTPFTTTLWAAPDAIIQVLTNLLSNAIKFSYPGETVGVRAELGAGEPSSVLFTVRDHGRGIPADKLGLIFDRFQQVDASDSRRRGGTGLGLAICKRIVQQHQGRIWVESQVGQGSTFYVALPLTQNHGHD